MGKFSKLMMNKFVQPFVPDQPREVCTTHNIDINRNRQIREQAMRESKGALADKYVQTVIQLEILTREYGANIKAKDEEIGAVNAELEERAQLIAKYHPWYNWWCSRFVRWLTSLWR